MINAALHLAAKDLRLLSRDRIALFWVLGFPVIFALFIGAVVRAGLSGEQSPFSLVVVHDARDEASSMLAQRLAEHARIDVTRATLDEARHAVRHADAIAYLSLPAGFQPGVVSQVKPELGFDPAREMEVAYVEQLLQQMLGPLNPKAAHVVPPPAFELEKRRVARAGMRTKSASDIVFPSAVLWGLIGCAACFAVSLVAERTRGTYVRLRALPVTRHTLLAGKAISALAASLFVGVFLTVVGALVFDIHVSSVFKLGVALGSTALCFVGITVALSVLGKSEQAVAGAGWATLLLMAMLGGGMVPLSLMPEWLTTASHVSPVKWGILALEGATFRAFSLAELFVPCAVLVGVGATSFVLGSLLFSRAET